MFSHSSAPSLSRPEALRERLVAEGTYSGRHRGCRTGQILVDAGDPERPRRGSGCVSAPAGLPQALALSGSRRPAIVLIRIVLPAASSHHIHEVRYHNHTIPASWQVIPGHFTRATPASPPALADSRGCESEQTGRRQRSAVVSPRRAAVRTRRARGELHRLVQCPAGAAVCLAPLRRCAAAGRPIRKYRPLRLGCTNRTCRGVGRDGGRPDPEELPQRRG
jgi:hypothetical protein